MGTLPSRRDRKSKEKLIEDQVSVGELESIEAEKKAEEIEEMDVLKLPSRSEIYGKKEKQNKGPTRREKQVEKEVFSRLKDEEVDEVEAEEESYATPQRRKKSFPLVNLLFILFFLIVIAVSTYPLWIEKLF